MAVGFAADGAVVVAEGFDGALLGARLAVVLVVGLGSAVVLPVLFTGDFMALAAAFFAGAGPELGLTAAAVSLAAPLADADLFAPVAAFTVFVATFLVVAMMPLQTIYGRL